MSLKGGTQSRSGVDAGSPTKGEVFEVLSNERRRYVLRAMRETDSSVDLGSLAEQVAAWENDIPVEQVTYSQRKSVYTALQQSHLPKMDEAGAIRFEEHRGVVDSDTHMGSFDYYLTVVPSGTLVFSHYYLFLGVASTIVGLSVGTGFLSIGFLPDMALAAGIIGVFGALIVLHMFQRPHAKMERPRQEASK